ncbi:hypothetical protein [Psychroserpens ponticola]|uniref:Uncharacterized protein n=1 Tax=Psychroserpens ponticola TaxID=2932268 RepID=A0ABY7RUN0_9FLAO|nr:hypothetical protein [Psychroserpens ponticola]WCO00523.1 hypothetical protein MUN68_010630 [Psychroserpens ponticola]
MQIGKFLGALTLVLSLFFLGLQFKGLEVEAAGVRALTIVMLTALYVIRIKNRHPLFLSFLIVFVLAEVFNYFTWVVDLDIAEEIDYYYYIGNTLYILSYLFLVARITVGMNMKRIVVKFPIQIVLLFVLSLFFVYFVSDTAKKEFNTNEYYLELFYNAVIMLLMALALINYMSKDDKKSMNLLLGTICIMFSEVIQLAYFYIAEFNLLNVLCSLFLVFAFLFFYLQSRLENRQIVDYSQQDVDIPVSD